MARGRERRECREARGHAAPAELSEQVVLPWRCHTHSNAWTASKLVAFCLCLVFPQTAPVWISCRRGSWHNRSCCAEPPVPRE